jgi:hypothetical protein
MKKEEVPQDKSSLSKSNLKELVYATDENGNYTTIQSSGWEPKTIALSNSIEEINEQVEKAKQKVLKGEVSPVCYFMELNKMDITILSSYMGMWQWRVKRHFNPKVFTGLSKKIINKYAKVFNITPEALINFKTD